VDEVIFGGLAVAEISELRRNMMGNRGTVDLQMYDAGWNERHKRQRQKREASRY
jgi:hypothetical protein